jgi:hypothetical protein
MFLQLWALSKAFEDWQEAHQRHNHAEEERNSLDDKRTDQELGPVSHAAYKAFGVSQAFHDGWLTITSDEQLVVNPGVGFDFFLVANGLIYFRPTIYIRLPQDQGFGGLVHVLEVFEGDGVVRHSGTPKVVFVPRTQTEP